MAADFPVALDLVGRRAVVIGGDDAAAALASRLFAHGADVAVVAIAASLDLHALAAGGDVALVSREYVRGDLAGAVLAACFEGGEVAHAVAAEAERERCLIYIAEHPELSNVRVTEPAVRQPGHEERA